MSTKILTHSFYTLSVTQKDKTLAGTKHTYEPQECLQLVLVRRSHTIDSDAFGNGFVSIQEGQPMEIVSPSKCRNRGIVCGRE